ncbi:MAG TPA: flagellar protein FlgN [Firmicutes bacterium]|jgi:flagellar biosynthesis/type III secretory pathway chaperone|nr:flagellar protein FlgN [Bacillota bacterium]HHT43023.1 flagellar protein FlgN [Bacillota bacterium]
MTVWDDFVAALHEENGLLEQLIALGTAKQEQINNAPEVARIADEEQKVLARLEEVDRLRASLFDVMAVGRSLEKWLPTLTEEQSAVAEPLLVKLAENLGQLQAVNGLNQQLLAQALHYVQFSMNLLTGDEAAPTYAKTGASVPGRSYFDRKV